MVKFLLTDLRKLRKAEPFTVCIDRLFRMLSPVCQKGLLKLLF